MYGVPRVSYCILLDPRDATVLAGIASKAVLGGVSA
jgi:hypothetical protein